MSVRCAAGAEASLRQLAELNSSHRGKCGWPHTHFGIWRIDKSHRMFLSLNQHEEGASGNLATSTRERPTDLKPSLAQTRHARKVHPFLLWSCFHLSFRNNATFLLSLGPPPNILWHPFTSSPPLSHLDVVACKHVVITRVSTFGTAPHKSSEYSPIFYSVGLNLDRCGSAPAF